MKKYFVLSVFIMLIGEFTNAQCQNTVTDAYEIGGVRIGWMIFLFIAIYSFMLNAIKIMN